MENQNQQFDIRDYQPTGKERDFENALRPLQFGDFSGQDKVVDNLRIFVKAARLRAEALDHVLLHGPPGLGKTTLSNIIANELGVGFKVTSGPVLDKPGDLAGVLTSLEPNDSPPQPCGRRVSILGYGRLSYRYHDRQGSVGKKHTARP